MMQQLILQKLKEKVEQLAKKHDVNTRQIQIVYREGELYYAVLHQFGSPEKFPLSF